MLFFSLLRPPSVCGKSVDEQQKLTDSHPHGETDPRVPTQLKHQVNIDKYAENGQKGQERNL